MTKIAIFLADLGGGGAERVMINLANGFIACGLSVDLVLVYKEGPYLQQLAPEIKVIELSASKLITSVFGLANYLQQSQPEVLLTALEDTNIVAICASWLAKVKTRVYVTVHNNLSQESLNATNLKRKYVPRIIRWFYPHCDRVIAVSQGVADDLGNFGIAPEQIKVIYNPIFQPDLPQKAAEPIDFPWLEASNSPVILGVGRLEAQKDFLTLVKAFAQVKTQVPARLLILGEGSQKQELMDLASSLGLSEADITFPGFVDNPFAYMQRASVLAMSSTWEGFGNVLVEAMGLGTSVVATDCPSGPAEILAAGEYGQLVPVKDPQAMANAIFKTLQNPLASDILRQRAEEFSLAKSVAAYCQVMNI